MDPHWFRCGSGSKKPNQCVNPGGSGSGSWSDFWVKKVEFRILHEKYSWSTVATVIGQRQKTRFICKFWSISMLLDPDLHSQYDSGFKTEPNECGSRWIRIRIYNTGWNWGKWGFKEYKWNGPFFGWFVGLVVLTQETLILPRLLWAVQYKIVSIKKCRTKII